MSYVAIKLIHCHNYGHFHCQCHCHYHCQCITIPSVTTCNNNLIMQPPTSHSLWTTSGAAGRLLVPCNSLPIMIPHEDISDPIHGTAANLNGYTRARKFHRSWYPQMMPLSYFHMWTVNCMFWGENWPCNYDTALYIAPHFTLRLWRMISYHPQSLHEFRSCRIVAERH